MAITRLGAYGASRALYGSFAGRAAAAPEPEIVGLIPGGIGHRRKKYPRRIYIDGRLVTVRNADDERRLLQAMAERAQEQAKLTEFLGDKEVAQVINRKAIKLKKRIEETDDRESQWLDYLRDEDEELLSILLH